MVFDSHRVKPSSEIVGTRPVGLRGEVLVFVRAPEQPARVVAPVRNVQFLAAPEHLLHVERVLPAPDLDHCPLPSERVSLVTV